MAHPVVPLAAPVAARYACTRCTGVLPRTGLGAAPVCPNGAEMVPTIPTATVTNCLHDVNNFRLLPAFTKTHFVPQSGRGKFDVKYTPNSGVLDVTVKLNLTTTPRGWFGRGFTAEELQEIRQDFAANVPAFWDGKWAFRCTKAGFGGLAIVTPRFHIEFNVQGAHFSLVIAVPDAAAERNPSPELRNCRGFVSINQISSGDPTAQDRVELLDFHVRDFQHSIAPKMIAQNERQRLEEALKAVGVAATEGVNKWIFVAFDALGDAERLRLRAFATEGKKRVGGTHKVPLVMAGVARGGEAGGKGRERAEAVAAVLTTAGFDNPVTYAPSTVGEATGVKIRVDVGYDDTVGAITYNVAAHEFGHMIGLPDEYENPQMGAQADTNAKAKAKTNYLKLLGEAGLAAPTFPSHTMSMMSDGMTIQPFHTVTIWDALCFLTKGIIARDEWEVAMI